jgi:integrase
VPVYSTKPERIREGAHRGCWRCEIRNGEGRLLERIVERTKVQLLERAEARLRALGARTNARELSVSGAIAVFIMLKLRYKAWAPETTERMREDLHHFADVAGYDRDVRTLDRKDVRRYLTRMQRDGVALGSQQSRYASVSSWFGWMHCDEILGENPAALVHQLHKPWTGKRAQRRINRGKPQLHGTADAKLYLVAALQHDTAEERVAAALPLLCGLRSGEVRHLRAGDVDLALQAIWVRPDEAVGAGGGWDVKTASSVRTVPIPDELRDDLLRLRAHKADRDPIFWSRRSKTGLYEAAWLRRLVQRTCRAAGVKVVSPHGLRGTFVSICAALGRLSAPDIARLVGHADHGATVRRNYLGTGEHGPALKLVVGGG